MTMVAVVLRSGGSVRRLALVVALTLATPACGFNSGGLYPDGGPLTGDAATPLPDGSSPARDRTQPGGDAGGTDGPGGTDLAPGRDAAADASPADGPTDGGVDAADLPVDAASDAPGSDLPADVTPGPDLPPGCGVPVVGAALCARATGLVACYRFENNLKDDSGNHNDLTGSSTAFTTGRDGQGLITSPMTSYSIANNNSFDAIATANQLTVEMFAKPRVLPTGTRGVLLDKDLAFALYVNPDGTVSCTAGAGVLTTPASMVLVTGIFTHVACTFDGTNRRIFLDGAVAASDNATDTQIAGGDLHLGENSPTRGDPFDGELDSLRIWSLVRSDAEICGVSRGP
jgi:hypothetical protein